MYNADLFRGAFSSMYGNVRMNIAQPPNPTNR